MPYAGRLCLAVALASTAAVTGRAHHDVAVAFDVTRTITLSGTISRAQLANPHVVIVLATKDAQGAAVEWSIEMAAPNALLRRGLATKDLLAIAREVTVEAWPARDGTPRASGRFLVTTGGDKIDIADRFTPIER